MIGQIHARNDQPIGRYDRKLPQNKFGSIYCAHDPGIGKETWGRGDRRPRQSHSQPRRRHRSGRDFYLTDPGHGQEGTRPDHPDAAPEDCPRRRQRNRGRTVRHARQRLQRRRQIHVLQGRCLDRQQHQPGTKDRFRSGDLLHPRHRARSAPGALGLVSGSSGRGIRTTFAPQTLSEGQTLKATFKFTTPDTIGTDRDSAFRIGTATRWDARGWMATCLPPRSSRTRATTAWPGYLIDFDIGIATATYARTHKSQSGAFGRCAASRANGNPRKEPFASNVGRKTPPLAFCSNASFDPLDRMRRKVPWRRTLHAPAMTPNRLGFALQLCERAEDLARYAQTPERPSVDLRL